MTYDFMSVPRCEKSHIIESLYMYVYFLKYVYTKLLCVALLNA